MLTNLINRATDGDGVLFNLIGRPAILAAAFFVGTGSASAHDFVDEKTPSTFAEGLLSGVSHPIIGPDYLAFCWRLGLRSASCD